MQADYGAVSVFVNLTEKYQRKLVIDGYGMRMNAEIAQKLGYLKVKSGTIIKSVQANKMQDRKVVILATGAQGEGGQPKNSQVDLARFTGLRST